MTASESLLVRSLPSVYLPTRPVQRGFAQLPLSGCERRFRESVEAILPVGRPGAAPRRPPVRPPPPPPRPRRLPPPADPLLARPLPQPAPDRLPLGQPLGVSQRVGPPLEGAGRVRKRRPLRRRPRLGPTRRQVRRTPAAPAARSVWRPASPQAFAWAAPSPYSTRAQSDRCSDPWKTSSNGLAPGNCPRVCFPIQSAPSARTETSEASRTPRRAPQRRMARAEALRRLDPPQQHPGVRRRQPAACPMPRPSPAGPAAAGRRCPGAVSRQPSPVLTLVPSVWNATSPAAVRTLRSAWPLRPGAVRRRRCVPAPFFFGRLGLGRQGRLDGPAGEFADGGDGEGPDAGQDVAVRGRVGARLQLLGQEKRLLDPQRRQRGRGPKRAWLQGSSLGRKGRQGHASGPKLPETIPAPAAARRGDGESS